MKFSILRVAFLLFALLWVTSADAATCFWVGGTATWDNSTDAAHWSASSNGAGSTCAATGGVPKNAGDTATFDGSSGGGTVTVNTNLSIASVDAGAFTGTLDWSANNNNASLTGTLIFSGTGTRTINCGSGTFTLSGSSGNLFSNNTTTGETLSCSSAAFILTATTAGVRNFLAGGKSLGSLTINSNSSRGIVQITGAGNTFGTLSIGSGNTIEFGLGQTQNITTAPTFVGTSSLPITLQSGANTSGTATVSVAAGTFSCTWCYTNAMAYTGGATFTFTNSLDGGLNTGATITAPTTGGGGGRIIGG